jgi:glycosyltransferase involved in cell wall biosynthesis
MTYKILHVEAEYNPGLGYQVNLISKYMAKLGHEVIILSTELNVVRKHQKPYLDNYNEQSDIRHFNETNVRIIRVPALGIISDRHIWSFKVYKIIKKLEPDIIFLHDNDTLVSIVYLLFFIKKQQIPLITDSHMVALASKNKLSRLFQFTYRRIVTPIINKNSIKVIRTVEDDFIFKVFNIPEELAPVISFGSDVDRFRPDQVKKYLLRKKYGIPIENRVFIYTGKLSIDKHGLFLANALKDGFVNNSVAAGISFLIVSSVTGDYGEQVEKVFKKSRNHIIRIPFVKYKDLADIILTADVAMIHYAASLIYYDYLASGLPVIWSDIEINKNRSDERFVSLFCNLNQSSFRDAIQLFIEMSSDDLSFKSKLAREHAVENYSYERITDRFLELFTNEINYRKSHPFK